MTREEFVKKWADDFLGKLARCAAMDKTTALFPRWMSAQVIEIDAWLGNLHDELTERLNAHLKGKPEGKPGAAGAGGPQAAKGAPRNAA